MKLLVRASSAVCTALLVAALAGGGAPALAGTEGLSADSLSRQSGKSASLKITQAALETLGDGQLSLDAVGAADEVRPEAYLLPVSAVLFTPSGELKALRLSGGVQITGSSITLELTKFRVNVPSEQATVKASSLDTRIPAFDVARLKLTKKKVSGVLLVAPGTSAVLNAEFDTYVFTDGLRFARFEYPV